MGSPLIAYAATLGSLESALNKPGATADDIRKAVEAADASHKSFMNSEDVPSDRNILAAMAHRFYKDIDPSQHPDGVYDKIAQYGSLDDATTYTKWAADVFQNSIIADCTKWHDFAMHPVVNTLKDDPAYQFAAAFLKNYNEKVAPKFMVFNNKNNELGRAYLKGIMERDPVAAAKMYPDANFSMRVSFGNVKSYKPRDGIFCDYVTTASGILEKYKPGDYEFDLPQKQVELFRKRDFGQYIDKKKNDLIIGFITTNDITGGNSGSPVIDGKGQLIGLAFDGNYEALSHKIEFDKDLNRTICVDVRYVLWCIEKLGGAKNLIDEIKPVR
jgi:hypothetical protein